MFRVAFFSLGVVVVLTSFSCEPQDLCARVHCRVGKVCDPSSGLCFGPDGGEDEVDSGAPDSGTPDAGQPDAGPIDSGQPDSGQPDSGAVDAGLTCIKDIDCPCGVPFCQDGGVCTDVVPSDAGIAPPGETCASAPKLVFPACGPSSLSFSVNLATMTNDSSPTTCSTSSAGKDGVYLFRLDGTFDIRVTATRAGGLATPLLYLQKTPCSGPELVCRDGTAGASTVRVKSATAGVYALYLDAFDAASSGLLNVQLELLAPTEPSNETCASALRVVDGGVFDFDLSLADDDARTTECGGLLAAPELVYQLELSKPTDLIAVATSLDGGVGPTMYLRSNCSAAAELACHAPASGSSRIKLRNTAVGSYSLFVEGQGSGTLSLDLLPGTASSPNSTCSGAYDIVFDQSLPDGGSFEDGGTTFPAGTVRFSQRVDPWYGEDHTNGGCNTWPAGSSELIYRFTLLDTSDVRIETVPLTAETDLVVSLRQSSCSDTGSQIDCDDAFAGQTDTLAGSLFPGTYYVIVEGFGPHGLGPAQLNVTVSP